MADFDVTKEDVIAIAPELGGSTLSPEEWEAVLYGTELEINLMAFGSLKRGNWAARYLAAHKAAKLNAARQAGSGAGGAAGPLASVTVGSVSMSYAAAAGSSGGGSAASNDLSSTAYGREYLRLVRTQAPRILKV